jgi:MFS family permease
MPGRRPPIDTRKSSTLHYQTFPTAPPRTRGRPLSSLEGDHSGDESDDHHHESPLPTRQLVVLAIIALAEQTALNSISPYLPEMTKSFPEVKDGQTGLYVGLIASSFALAQFTTNFLWGWLSDKIGRKPVIIMGTFLTMCCFMAFGFCRTLWQAVMVQALMGLVNGNSGVVSTCLGEITDRSNQSRAFTYLPVVYGVGGITGPIVGGLLVFYKNPLDHTKPNPYPYLLPNLFSAAVLAIDLIVCMIFLEESLDEAKHLPPLGKRLSSLFSWMWQFTSSSRPTYVRRLFGKSSPRHARSDRDDDDEDDDDDDDDDDASDSSGESAPTLFPHTNGEMVSRKDILNRDTILLLVTYFIFQLANISYNSLYPIFAEEQPPTGRGLKPEAVGLSLSFAGAITIVFQVGIFGKLRGKMGNKVAYRVSLALFVAAFILMPWVGYKNSDPYKGIGSGAGWLWFELGVVLVIKTIAGVGGLTAALLLVRSHLKTFFLSCCNLLIRTQITNSAPNHNVLGTLNGLAQTLSAAGRAAGPFVSGSLFTAATKIRPKGEALPFGIFAGISLLGFCMSFGIRGAGLEDDSWSDESDDEDEEEDVGEDSNEQTGLIRK